MSNFEVNYRLFSECIDKIVYNIEKRKEQYDVIIAPARGGLVPATVLSHILNVPLWPILWSTRDFIRREPIPAGLADFLTDKQKVLIVEDIVDSGKTISELTVVFQQLFEEDPLEIDTACIVFNPEQSHHQVTYYGVMLAGGSDTAYTDFFWEKRLSDGFENKYGNIPEKY